MSMSPPLAMVGLKGEESKVSEQTATPKLTGQFSKALVYAELKHHNQVRKGGDIPYVGHLLTVAGLVINDGGSEAQAIAALLHDAVEDAGGPATLEEIKKNFGDEVARIVEECSDTDEEPKPPWLDRKQNYINHLADVGEDTLLVSVADKLDNARSMLRDYHTHGPSLWERFTARTQTTTSGTTANCSNAYRSRGCTSWMVDELGRVVDELRRLVESGDQNRRSLTRRWRLHLHRAERTDLLADGLGALLATPLPDPFAEELVIVPAKGVERWLSQRL